MKIIINENERGFLIKNGIYRKMMMPGRHYIKRIMGETYARVNIAKSVEVANIDIAVLLRDKEFQNSVVSIDVPDGYIALHMENNRIAGTLKSGTYCFWKSYREHSFKLIDISQTDITDVTPEQLRLVSRDLYSKIEILDGEAGLLFFDGKFKRMLESGSYYFWNNMQKVTYQSVDLRVQQLDIAGQEILTADKVSLRINFVCTYKIADAVKIVSEIKDYKTQIYTLTQLALREYIGKFRFDELLEQKDSIAAFVLKQLKSKQESLFVEFFDAGLKDIILPGEIRDIMNTVLVAEKNAQANVISRREEVASTRSLLNTAKLMEENATLYKLKELEYLEKICDKVGNISVGGGNLLSELRKIVSVS
ncbi:MAG: slipin family protein [Lachnospiraceae bacterium]|nr:slipin family protein [Lachnospiraceae bacterium]